jgi:hypothetical protein
LVFRATENAGEFISVFTEDRGERAHEKWTRPGGSRRVGGFG